MKALSLNPNEKNLSEIDIQMQPNTVYTFFGSILIDEQVSLKNHIIYTDANALEENKIPFFLGEQLLIGNTLITGQEEHENKDISISLKEIESLISYDINQFYKDVLKVLSQTEVNLYRSFIVEKEYERIHLNVEWVLYTFNIADERTKEYFLNELKKSLHENNTQNILEEMAHLAMNAA